MLTSHPVRHVFGPLAVPVHDAWGHSGSLYRNCIRIVSLADVSRPLQWQSSPRSCFAFVFVCTCGEIRAGEAREFGSSTSLLI
mmetsp:Transcript_44911/g.112941  ORF Transcript_44911/g.112941 Transcript_44911/m.112941 type:complete len:83 (-) Transcript_44911:25-273(-)